MRHPDLGPPNWTGSGAGLKVTTSPGHPRLLTIQRGLDLQFPCPPRSKSILDSHSRADGIGPGSRTSTGTRNALRFRDQDFISFWMGALPTFQRGDLLCVPVKAEKAQAGKTFAKTESGSMRD